MRAMRLDGPGSPLQLEHLPLPRLWPGEALVKVVASGVCHTELQLQAGVLNPGVWPITLGHEIVGHIVEAADDLSRVGQRVAVYYSNPCGACSWCTTGQEQVCPNAGSQPGLSADGGFAEYVRVPLTSLLELPDGLDPIAAAPLGCAAASALHALDAVAHVRPHETIVVYGVGGVGLALIQLARLRGARVLAVSRSASRRALAAQLGADVIDGAATAPLLGVRRATGGEGADVVFELVGSETTMPAALHMLRRQGRLVCVGYSNARLSLNPLHLIVRECRILSSLGNTRAELAEVLRLAAVGLLRVPIAGRFALEDAPHVLQRLAAGDLDGRAVLDPSLPPTLPPPSRAPASSTPSGVSAPAAATVPVRGTTAPPLAAASSDVRVSSQGNGVSAPAEASSEVARVAAPSVAAASDVRTVSPASGVSADRGNDASKRDGRGLAADLWAFVSRGIDVPRDDEAFNALALRLFAYQFSTVDPYRRLAERRGRTPATVRDWRDLPAMPIAAFKETLLLAEPTETGIEFNSSGTQRPERKSRHIHPNLDLYDLNARQNFATYVLPDREKIRCLVLFPHRLELPHSSLAHWLSLQVETYGTADSAWFVTHTDGLAFDQLTAALRATAEPVAVLAASFGLVHFLEQALERGIRFTLPPGSRVMDTGGYKGRSREYAKDELYDMVSTVLGISPTHIVNMYGMTEHGTQFLDSVLRDHLAQPTTPLVRRKYPPPWARTLVVDPETLLERPAGERGVLLHVDLINRTSALVVLSEDIGYALAGGFEVLGRAQGSDARGCSIALDELIEAMAGSRG